MRPFLGSLLLVLFLPLLSWAAEVVIKNEKCKHCQFLVETLQAGLTRTARDHFGGGDTAWEEKNLGKYATSETRLVEIHESLCKKRSLANTDKYNGLGELEFQCAALLEENEELIEEYYYKHQELNAEGWLCIQQLKLCCPDGHYGPECSKCPAVDIGANSCFGHGQCHGAGSRKGTGKCKCDAGYVGNQCRHCDADYFEISKTETTVECQKCYEGCAGGCTAAGSLGCNKCRSGWELKEGEGCTDIDECTVDPSKCSAEHEKCVNSIGSYSCECVEGYKRDNNKCIIDFEATPHETWLRPDLLLRFISMSSLAAIVTLVVWRKSYFLMFLTAVAVVLICVIEIKVNPGSIPDEAQKFLAF